MKNSEVSFVKEKSNMTTHEEKSEVITQNDTRLRILYLYQLLSEQSDETHPLTTNQIISKMQELHDIHMHRTTVSSDIALLKAAGFDIISERKRLLSCRSSIFAS